jgi:elongator complex protein 2
MVTPSSRLIYCSAAANRSSNVSDVGKDGLVAFGSGRLIALWNSEVSTLNWPYQTSAGQDSERVPSLAQDPDSSGVHQTLPGHLGEVTVLKFVKGTTDTFVSGDATGQAIVWKHDGDKASPFSCKAR